MISLPDEASGPETGCLTGVPYIEKPCPFISPNLPYMVILRDCFNGILTSLPVIYEKLWDIYEMMTI